MCNAIKYVVKLVAKVKELAAGADYGVVGVNAFPIAAGGNAGSYTTTQCMQIIFIKRI